LHDRRCTGAAAQRDARSEFDTRSRRPPDLLKVSENRYIDDRGSRDDYHADFTMKALSRDGRRLRR